MKVFIINYNRLTLSKNTADWCAKHGLEPIFIDNHSDYLPLLKYYMNCPYEVYRLAENRGHRVISTLNLNTLFGVTGMYIVTDPDLDFTGVPDDFLTVMREGLEKYPFARKCGLSLEINDLPNSVEGNFIRSHAEPTYWRKPLDNMYFNAPVDTTFVLYRTEYSQHFVGKSIRTNRPYTARHLPWYYTDLSLLPKDEQYYWKTANGSSSGKERLVL
jgi:hypothetical protein